MNVCAVNSFWEVKKDFTRRHHANKRDVKDFEKGLFKGPFIITRYHKKRELSCAKRSATAKKGLKEERNKEKQHCRLAVRMLQN